MAPHLEAHPVEHLIRAADAAITAEDFDTLMYPENDATTRVTRRATYVFRKTHPGTWACVIDNSYGTSLLDAPEGTA